MKGRPHSTIPDETWHSLVAQIEEAKLHLIVARRKIRSENAKINFKNFLRGFVIETDTIAFIYAQHYPKVRNPTADYNTVKLMAQGAMAVYGAWDAKDPVSITSYWEVPPMSWWKK